MTTTTKHADEVAATIRQQITPGVLMSLGAHELAWTVDRFGNPGLTFKARIIPNKQSRVRIMRVTVTLTAADTYDIEVGYLKSRTFEWVSHYETTNIYNDQLAPTLL